MDENKGKGGITGNRGKKELGREGRLRKGEEACKAGVVLSPPWAALRGKTTVLSEQSCLLLIQLLGKPQTPQKATCSTKAFRVVPGASLSPGDSHLGQC